ncbi:hypothetical protein JVT61DRAFT_11218 [Boletus reticuloceps]|uniref:Uncharacterized protein n=1 Tax=Boletus reticuloceps TaxID=495285 RepID=A0A8I2YEN2_9AGAM|nr:hypothetical protein JVT61DRAFT_11218 [Boletus reticuloceps]
MIYATRVIAFIGLLALATSLPLSERAEPDLGARLLVVITSPTLGDQVCIGSGLDVRWVTTTRPYTAYITNPTGNVYLVQNGVLDTENRPASNFPLAAGQVKFTAPINRFPGTYQLAMDPGGSGSCSPLFELDVEAIMSE